MGIETRTGYKPNHADMAKLLLSEQTHKPALEAAAKIVEAARLAAPKVTGKLAEGYKVNEHPAPVVLKGNPRQGAEVFNEDPAAAPLEFGNAKVRNPQHILARAGAKVGEMRGEVG